MDGEQLLISSGYISQLELLPWEDMLQSVSHLILATGHWDDPENKKNLAGVTENAKRFALMLQQKARSLNLKPPIITFYTGSKWHAKVALKRRKNEKTISGAVIGSSNLSYPALHQAENPNYFNQEVDVLITEDDGPDAAGELAKLYEDLGSSFEGKRVDLAPSPSVWASKTAPVVVSGAARSMSIASYRAAQAIFTLTSAFHQLKNDAIGFDATPFSAQSQQQWVGVVTLEKGLDAVEIYLAGQAAWVFCDRIGQPFAMPVDLCAADLAQADRVLRSWRVPLLRDELLKSAVEKLEDHCSEWLDIVKLLETEMDGRTSISRDAIESIPSVQQL